MGVPDLGDLPALVRCFVKVGIGVRCIDADGFIGFRIVDQETVVVVKAAELMDFKHCRLLDRYSNASRTK